MGRDPAAVGVLADGAAPRRLPARAPGDAARPGGDRALHGRGPRRRARRRRARRARAGAWKPASRRSGTRRWRCVALSDAGLPATTRRWCAPPSGCSARRSPCAATGRSPRPSSRPGGWAFEFANVNYPDVDDTAEVVLALQRVATARSAPRGTARNGARRGCDWRRASTARSTARALGRGHAERGRRLGRVRRRQHARARARAAVPGLRRGDRRAERRRHRARASRCSPRSGLPTARRPRGAACAGCSSSQEPDGSWFGRWGVNHVYGTGAARARADRRRASAPSDAVHPPRGALAGAPPERRRRLGRGPALLRRPAWIGRGPSTASQTAWALLALHAAGERSQALERGVELARGHPARRRQLGRAPVHRHRLSLRLLHQLPPVPAHVPDHGARPLPAATRRRERTATGRAAG